MYGDLMGVIRGHLHEVWEVYGDPIWVIRGCLYAVLKVYWDPMGVMGGRLYEVWEVYGDPRGSWGVWGLGPSKNTPTITMYERVSIVAINMFHGFAN